MHFFTALLFSLCLVTSLGAQKDEVSVEFSSYSLLPGERISFSIRATGTETAFLKPLPKIDGIHIEHLSTSSPKSPAGRDTLFRMELRADREGTFTLPPIEIEIPSGVSATQAIALEVVSPQSLIWQKVRFEEQEIEYAVRWTREKSDLYPGEASSIGLHVYLPELAGPPKMSFPRDQSSGLTTTPLLPINPDESKDQATGRTYLRGRRYFSFNYFAEVSSLQAGTLRFGPCTTQALFPVRRRRGIQFREIKLNGELQLPALEFRGLPFPEPPPQGFTGSIGKFQLSLRTSDRKLTLGTPIEVELELKGGGKSGEIAAPNFTGEAPWRLISLQRLRSNNAAKSIRYQALLMHPSTPNTLPSFQLISFDPKTLSFVETQTPPLPLKWNRDSMSSGASIFPVPVPQNLTPANNKISSAFQPISERPEAPRWRREVPAPFWWHPLVGVATLLPLLVLFASAQHQRRLRKHPEALLIARLKAIPQKIPDHEFLKRFAGEIEQGIPAEGRPELVRQIIAQRDLHCFSPDKDSFHLPRGQRSLWLRELSKVLSIFVFVLCTLCSAIVLKAESRENHRNLNPAEVEGLSSDQLVNQANDYAHSGNWSFAAFYLRLALAAEPHHNEAKKRLDLVHQVSGTQLPPPSPWRSAVAQLSRSTYRYAAPPLVICGTFLLIISLFPRKGGPLLRISGLLFIILGISCIALYRFYPEFYSQTELTRMALATPETRLHNIPLTSKEGKLMAPASPLIIEETRSDWCMVRTPNGESAWVQRRNILPFYD